LVLAGGIVGALALTGGDNTPPPPNKSVPAKNGSSGSKSSSSGTGGALQRGDVTVSALNGTTLTGLAGDTRDRAVAAGFAKGAVGDNSDQTIPESIVYYADGFKRAAQEVAAVLKIKKVEALPSTTAAIIGSGDVVILVGADRLR
jgi:hypothetical protein